MFLWNLWIIVAGIVVWAWIMKGAMLCFLLLGDSKFFMIYPRYYQTNFQWNLQKYCPKLENLMAHKNKGIFFTPKWSISNRKTNEGELDHNSHPFPAATIIQSAFDRPKVINLSSDMVFCFFSFLFSFDIAWFHFVPIKFVVNVEVSADFGVEYGWSKERKGWKELSGKWREYCGFKENHLYL